MTATWHIGDTRAVLARLADDGVQVDLVLTSPPFLALRSYLPDDDPAKAAEIGSERTPGAFLDVLLDVVEACGRILAPHGSIAVELGDTYAGGGGGPDARHAAKADAIYEMNAQTKLMRANPKGWPLDKSLTLIPETFAWALAYGRNPWTGRTIDPWRVRNFAPWVRPNPPVGALGDKYRPASSYFTIATRARDRWFDLDAVRTAVEHPNAKASHLSGKDVERRGSLKPYDGSMSAGAPPLDWTDTLADVVDEIIRQARTEGKPLTGKLLSNELRDSGYLDWGDVLYQPTEPYAGAHYATWPRALCTRPILSMCPERVCTTCGAPSRRITTNPNAGHGRNPWNRSSGEPGFGERPNVSERITTGWSDCGHGTWRRGITLDPFAGSGTTLLVATGNGRDAIGIDLDPRNYDLARERIGMFLDVVDARVVDIDTGGLI